MNATPQLLIIEDDEDSRFLYAEIAESVGLSSIQAPTGEAAHRYLLEEGIPAVVLMDLTVPGFSPGSLIADLRRLSPDKTVPVVVISGRDDIREVAREIGAQAYLKKPVDLEDLVTQLEKLSP